jgi:hypothetical protein
MKKYLFVGAILLFLAAGCNSSKTASNNSIAGQATKAGTIYTDSSYNFQIDIPNGFYKNTGGYDGVTNYFVFFSTQPGAGASMSNIEDGKDNDDALLNISIDHSNGQIYKSLADVKKEEAANSSNIKYSDQKNMLINNLPAYEVMDDSTQSKGNVDTVCALNTYIQQGSDVHSIELIAANCAAVLKYKNEYDASVGTFKFVK